ncbi:hypothetical protein LTSEWAN_2525 [Salmonella enterica subsp. enterica serovar Wandsworth str. A4-580]|uniref:Uncharacterized protein n=1 Tax=Salmonella enterica subsp. enterica serovar Wandsworth str. A4-580 TaxID=913086 RepID=G5SBI9_SALET|nr:hypothetical protein LTSEWAN_2525 [Salmonella enterica subsp. enterica serovar Wandsworth str. A4-580]
MRSVVGKSLPLADRTASKSLPLADRTGQDRQRKLARTRFYA